MSTSTTRRSPPLSSAASRESTCSRPMVCGMGVIAFWSMAELVLHLERLGYVERVADPSDRRAKLVRATPRGGQLYAIAREVVAELEAEWTRRLGKAKMRQLRALLEELNAAL